MLKCFFFWHLFAGRGLVSLQGHFFFLFDLSKKKSVLMLLLWINLPDLTLSLGSFVILDFMSFLVITVWAHSWPPSLPHFLLTQYLRCAFLSLILSRFLCSPVTRCNIKKCVRDFSTSRFNVACFFVVGRRRDAARLLFEVPPPLCSVYSCCPELSSVSPYTLVIRKKRLVCPLSLAVIERLTFDVGVWAAKELLPTRR